MTCVHQGSWALDGLARRRNELEEEVGEAVEGGVRQVVGVHAIEVIHVVAAHDEEEGPCQELAPLKFQMEAAASKHMAKWNHKVGPEAVRRMVPLWAGSLTGHWR